jgi:HlyD family secretion protein
LVGSDKDLVALVRVSQAKAEQLQLGQTAEINTRRETVAGVVTRITPEVREGTIEVEIEFTQGVPASARPELNVDARIFTATFNDSLFIERPINVPSNSKSSLFKVSLDGGFAVRQEVDFGPDSGRYIQVLGGASEADSFIISEIKNAQQLNRIKLVD